MATWKFRSIISRGSRKQRRHSRFFQTVSEQRNPSHEYSSFLPLTIFIRVYNANFFPETLVFRAQKRNDDRNAVRANEVPAVPRGMNIFIESASLSTISFRVYSFCRVSRDFCALGNFRATEKKNQDKSVFPRIYRSGSDRGSYFAGS